MQQCEVMLERRRFDVSRTLTGNLVKAMLIVTKT